MEIVELIEKEVKDKIENYKQSSEDNYDFWNEHIKFVYEESINLSKIYGANLTIVKLGALLHDIALIEKVGDRKDHHISGAALSKSILEKYNCPQEIVDKVIGCVINHRSSKNATNIEELCVADADILAHFDNIPMLFNSAFNRNNIKLNEVRRWMKEAFEKDYNDLSDNTKKIFKPRYKEICRVILREDI
ncbi:MAG: HDIG domain-containing protein [Firmicutes bacterium]|nr:HDIG domain-containing protein [Bacillota bacterium]